MNSLKVKGYEETPRKAHASLAAMWEASGAYTKKPTAAPGTERSELPTGTQNRSSLPAADASSEL